MKKLLLITFLIMVNLINAQVENKTKPNFYLSTGLSISNTQDTSFLYSSYLSIEGG